MPHFVFKDDSILAELAKFVAPNSFSLDAVKNIFLEATDNGVFAMATNTMTGGARVKIPGSRVITPGKLILPLSTGNTHQAFMKQIVQLKMDDGKNVIHAVVGDAKFDVPTINTDDFPEFPVEPIDKPTCVLSVDELKKLLSVAEFSSTDKNQKEEFKGIYIMLGKGKAASMAINPPGIFAHCKLETKSSIDFDPFEVLLTQGGTTLLQRHILTLTGSQELWLWKPNGHQKRLIVQTPDQSCIFWLAEVQASADAFSKLKVAYLGKNENSRSGVVSTKELKSVMENIIALIGSGEKSITQMTLSSTSQVAYASELISNGNQPLPITIEGEPVTFLIDPGLVKKAMDEMDATKPSLINISTLNYPVVFEQTMGNMTLRIPIMLKTK